jgi:DnaJ-class molecular chaperone
MIEEQPQKIAYEWVFAMSRGDDVIISEKRHEFYVANRPNGIVTFSDTEINPSFVVSAHRRPAQYLKSRYPCTKCHTTGRRNGNTGWCEACGGTGVDPTI